MNPTPDLDAIVELRRAATPGPWRVSQFGDDLSLVNLVDGNVDREVAPLEDVDEPDAAFIAAVGSFDFDALQSRLAALEGALLALQVVWRVSEEEALALAPKILAADARTVTPWLTPDPDSEERTEWKDAARSMVADMRGEYEG